MATLPFQILSIDDEPAVGQILVAVLEGEGHRVTTCKSGAEALQRFQNAQVPFDLVLTDHDMPGSHNGLAFVRILRARGYRGPILVASGVITPALAEEYRQYSVAFFPKPFDFVRLKSLLAGLAVISERSALRAVA